MRKSFLSAVWMILAGMLFCMPVSVVGKEKNDTLILNRIYEYLKANRSEFKPLVDNVYMKFRYNVEKRNFGLWLIPNTYVLAKDPREYIRETYTKATFTDTHHFDVNAEVVTGTMRGDRIGMKTLLDFMTPNIYNMAFYDGHVLSPFNKWNRHYYHFTQIRLMNGATRLDFRPKLYNTQLLNGYAVVETETGRILRTGSCFTQAAYT